MRTWAIGGVRRVAKGPGSGEMYTHSKRGMCNGVESVSWSGNSLGNVEMPKQILPISRIYQIAISRIYQIAATAYHSHCFPFTLSMQLEVKYKFLK